ncbi:MAG: cobalamin B12-binding domain-containing protein [Deltaproteobacteria bacterium]|nr:cobalamin B12-binding domain-containing protein [Deltaproteobacteria bacterium]
MANPAHADLSAEIYRPENPVRIVTAASLFDGHDAAINIMRRLLQAGGAEVIHLGHNRSVREIADAAVQEDVQGVAVSSYQGGHMEFFRYLRDLLVERGCGQIKIFGGGGGTIIPEEKRELEAYGVTRIYHPEDGRQMGLQGMINEVIALCDVAPPIDLEPAALAALTADNWSLLARLITFAEVAVSDPAAAERYLELSEALRARSNASTPVIGVTGTGGAGKSSLTDELLRRYCEDFPQAKVAVLSVDPSKRKTGGALLGDRIRMNSLEYGQIFMRSLATRGSGREISEALEESIAICKAAGFDLIIAETSGIGQADAAIVDYSDLSLYVMTPEFGAQSQLEKIEMIDAADLIVVNKFDKGGAEDALRDVRKAYQRAHQRFEQPLEQMPVYGAVASKFSDPGTNQVYRALLDALAARGSHPASGRFTEALKLGAPERQPTIPARRVRYLSEVADQLRKYRQHAEEQAEIAADLYALRRAVRCFEPQTELVLEPFGSAAAEATPEHVTTLRRTFDEQLARLAPRSRELLTEWPKLAERYRGDQYSYQVRGREIVVQSKVETLSGQKLPRVALPRLTDWGALLRFRLLENLPGHYPYTAGVFPFKRSGEDPTRMFAGEGGPARTNRRFHYLSRHATAKRLSTAFDSVTLYGADPDRRPDIWGKVGNAGVSIATVEDIEQLFAGFDLLSPNTSVSMTINGPAPAILAFYFNAAVRQNLRRQLKAAGKISISDDDCLRPAGGGYSFDDLRALIDDAAYAQLVNETVAQVRGTVQADILKEDQAQNTCIFSSEFALRLMGDVQEWFVEHKVRNFYSVSISGYHIAEAGANPISQLAFTLANGFTYVEYYRQRGMAVDDFAPNLSFFFSNGMDAEYSVIGRVARRIWATAMRELYGANERSQKLKYHIQTSGRSLHAQEIAFNDIRTTLQALLAVYDNCNSLHTNAYDEAVTTPTEESVRRALAIQLVINREFGLAANENPNQGSFVIEELTDLVEEAVLSEFDRLSDRGGVLGAMERMYQRSKIQEESLYYERLKDSGALPIIGVNTFLGESQLAEHTTLELMRSTDEEKEDQLKRLQDFHRRHAERAPLAIDRLKKTALAGENTFAALVDIAPLLSLGQISQALYQVGGSYRRNM